MKAQKLVLAIAVLFTATLFTSCSTNDTAEEDQLYEHGIDKKEIKNEDT
ncbi:hypothetical protein MNBD_BACTEROID03-476 [hydrothermal vent metagenome]|uniref:Uncharacterized protein n=1 Tax=hydrothermal vent metagenome TaxID=652676 RepID=A0A3B0T6C0_9ZZZZ